MITFEDDKVIIPRKIWDKYKDDDYFRELFEILQDSEELNEAIENSTQMHDLTCIIHKNKNKFMVKPI